eukprot:6213853-Pleurochrysis_carterae.AAC.2
MAEQFSHTEARVLPELDVPIWGISQMVTVSRNTGTGGAGGWGKWFAQHQGLVRLNESYLNAFSWNVQIKEVGQLVDLSFGKREVPGSRSSITRRSKFCSELAEVPPRNQTRCPVLWWCTQRPPTLVAVLQPYSPTVSHPAQHWA